MLSGHGVGIELALPPSLRVLVLDNVMRDARTLNLASMVRTPAPLCPFPLVPQECSDDHSSCKLIGGPGLGHISLLNKAANGMGHLPASLPPTVEKLAVVGEPAAASLAQAYRGLQVCLGSAALLTGPLARVGLGCRNRSMHTFRSGRTEVKLCDGCRSLPVSSRHALRWCHPPLFLYAACRRCCHSCPTSKSCG